MLKRKQDQIGGDDPWDTEIAHYVNDGSELHMARTFAILRWMYHGDFRPLAAAIKDGSAIDDAVLGLLARMIDEGRLTAKPSRRGRPQRPDKFPRDLYAALLYESLNEKKNSEAGFQYVADTVGMSHQSVRQAVTRLRKANAK
jgi:hypothetical protein